MLLRCLKAWCWRLWHAVWISVLSISPAVAAELIWSSGVDASWTAIPRRVTSGAGHLVAGWNVASLHIVFCFCPQSRPVWSMNVCYSSIIYQLFSVDFTCLVKPHCVHRVQRCGLLLQVFCDLCVFWIQPWATLKRLNRPRCRLGYALWWAKEPCIRWWRDPPGEGQFGASPSP